MSPDAIFALGAGVWIGCGLGMCLMVWATRKPAEPPYISDEEHERAVELIYAMHLVDSGEEDRLRVQAQIARDLGTSSNDERLVS